MEETIKYKTLPFDALIDVQISGTFYKKLVDLLSALADSVTAEEFQAVVEKLKTDDVPKDIFEINVHLILALIFEIETKAVAQNKVKEVEINAETGKPVTES
jgi:hydroxypyruvate isomerase